MLFFGKKKEDERTVPVDEVERMARIGMSDKDIIKNLKSQGYSYSEIEKAMVSAVKKGVGEQPLFPEQQQQQSLQAPVQRNEQQPRQLPQLPDLPEAPSLEEELGLAEGPEMDMNPEVIVEELVESVVEEKWQKFEDRIDRLEDEIIKLHTKLKEMSQITGQPVVHTKEDAKVQELSEQLEEVQARVGGLEKAFKQFLPTLSRNIESLSEMIHELKEKKGVIEA